MSEWEDAQEDYSLNVPMDDDYIDDEDVLPKEKFKKFGKRIGAKEIQTIIDMTNSTEPHYDRPDIAKAIGFSGMTVYNWQRKLGLIAL